MMIRLIRTSSDNPDFCNLVQLLDADLADRDGADHAFYAQYNKTDSIKYAVVAYDNHKPVACGAMKAFTADTVEIKRMYTETSSRKKGAAGLVLAELERWAGELNYGKCVLETGKRQPEAIAFYKKHGYKVIPDYGQYAGIENSVCFQKIIR
jgi:putative acetyltransferase